VREGGEAESMGEGSWTGDVNRAGGDVVLATLAPRACAASPVKDGLSACVADAYQCRRRITPAPEVIGGLVIT
jgi:hypothetical protein